jgi:hypothetical protein
MDMRAAIKITADVRGQQEIDRLRGSMTSLGGGVSKLTAALGALGIAFSAREVVSWVKSAVDAADTLKDLSQKTGIAVEELDALSLVAEQNGTDIESVSGALSRLAKTMGDALGGSVKAKDALSQFGITISEIRDGSITATEAVARISDRVEAMPDGLQKAAALQKLFGKSAAELVPLMNAGGNSIRNAVKELDAYGALIGPEFAATADEFNDRLAVMQRLSRSLAVEIGSELLPVINELLDELLLFVKSNGGISGIFDGLKADFDGLTTFLSNTAAEWQKIKPIFDWLDSIAKDYGPFSSMMSKPLEINIPADGVPTSKNAYDFYGTGAFKQKPVFGTGYDFMSGDEAEKAASAAQKRIDLLKKQNSEISDYVLRQSEAIDLLRLEGQAVNMSEFEYQQLVSAKQHEHDVTQATNDMLPETAAKYREVADSMFATRQAIEKLNYEQSRTFEFGIKTALRDYAEAAGNTADGINQAVTNAFQGMEDALVDFVKTGKLDFSSLVDSMISDLARLAIQQAILGPLSQALLGSLGFANGGVMTSRGAMPLKTYSSGGIARSPQVAVYGEGRLPEAYVPLPDGRNIPVKMDGATGGTSVVVNNYSGQQVSTNETTDGRGNRRVEVSVGDMVAGEIRRYGSAANMAIRSSFRTTPNLTGR